MRSGRSWTRWNGRSGRCSMRMTEHLRRRPISEKYAHEIDTLFEKTPNDDVLEV